MASFKKVGIGILGSVVLLAGIALIFLPGPAFIVIPAGFAILATQFEWAHKYLEKTKKWIRSKTHHRKKKEKPELNSP